MSFDLYFSMKMGASHFHERLPFSGGLAAGFISLLCSYAAWKMSRSHSDFMQPEPSFII